MSRLLILGAGQYGMVAREIAESMNMFDRIEFLDDNNLIAVGKINEYDKFHLQFDNAVVAVGNSELRLELIDKLLKIGFNVPVLMHSRACISPSASLGTGSFIEPMAVIHTDVSLGKGCIISAGTIVNHNAVIGDGCHLNCGTIVKARADIEINTKTEYGQIIG